MYDRFTDRARKVVQLAHQEAQRFYHLSVGTEHLLLGLSKEGSGVAARTLKGLGVDLRKLRLEVAKIAPHGSEELCVGALPLEVSVEKVLGIAAQEADCLGHKFIGTEHILLALLHESDCLAVKVLQNLDLHPGDVRQEVLMLLGCGPPRPRAAVREVPSRYHGVLEFISRIVDQSTKIAITNRCAMIEPIHVFGALCEVSGLTARTVPSAGGRLEQIHAAVRARLGADPPVFVPSRAKIPLGRSAFDVLMAALGRAGALESSVSLAGALLLALLEAPDRQVVQLLGDLCIDLEMVRTTAQKQRSLGDLAGVWELLEYMARDLDSYE